VALRHYFCSAMVMACGINWHDIVRQSRGSLGAALGRAKHQCATGDKAAGIVPLNDRRPREWPIGLLRALSHQPAGTGGDGSQASSTFFVCLGPSRSAETAGPGLFTRCDDDARPTRYCVPGARSRGKPARCLGVWWHSHKSITQPPSLPPDLATSAQFGEPTRSFWGEWSPGLW